MNYHSNYNLEVINFWAGPGAGKSLNAAALFAKLKKEYVSCELVTEYAKDLVWSERGNMFIEQDYIFVEQNHRLRRLVGKVSTAITDSPLAIGLLYLQHDYPLTFAPFVMEAFKSYNNKNIYLERNHAYDPVGRNQTESEAVLIDKQILEFLDRYRIPYTKIKTTDNTADIIYDEFFEQ
jgi:hypothetical protein